MEYTVTTVLPNEQHPLTVLSITLAYRDWCELEKSQEWENLCKFYDNLQNGNNPKSRQECAIKMSLPESCSTCPLSIMENYENDSYCTVFNRLEKITDEYYKERAPFCPLRLYE